ncbi:MAG: Crp/Fnr family transcriptional regulator [Anaerolineales bacterium]|nr:Crp/Fnr family transcriptional regulator [Anaerolineales bacterium]
MLPAPQHLLQQLSAVPHFRGLPAADLQAIIAAGHVRAFPAGALIFSEGQPGAGMFVLLQGQVQLRLLGPQGQEHLLAVIEPVIMFNEVAVLDGGPNVVTAVAIQPSLAWQISYERFQELLHTYPVIGLGLLRVLAARNRLLVSRHEDVAFRSVLARTARLLLDLSQHGQAPIDRRAHPNRELAARAATVPEALSRCLQTLQRDGHLRCTRLLIEITNPAGLAALADLQRRAFLE